MNLSETTHVQLGLTLQKIVQVVRKYNNKRLSYLPLSEFSRAGYSAEKNAYIVGMR